jgi:hypothetical protein
MLLKQTNGMYPSSLYSSSEQCVHHIEERAYSTGAWFWHLQELATTADMSLWPSAVKHLLLQNGTNQARDIRSGSKRKRKSEERDIGKLEDVRQ